MRPPSQTPRACAGFSEAEVLPWFETRKRELANRPLIREQAFGEALDSGKLEQLGRYEVHLDRKLDGCSPCFCVSRTCGRGRSRANLFGKTTGTVLGTFRSQRAEDDVGLAAALG